jgi:hypothetical protein
MVFLNHITQIRITRFMILYNFDSNNLINFTPVNSILHLPKIFNSVYVYRLIGLYTVCTYVKRSHSTCYSYTSHCYYVYATDPYFLSYVTISITDISRTSANSSRASKHSNFITIIFSHSVCIDFN